jgi:molybdenum cofactor guanylyltransferase
MMGHSLEECVDRVIAPSAAPYRGLRERRRIARQSMPGHPANTTVTRRSATVTGLILAGGRGSRLGGIDKGLLRVEDQPLIQHVAQRLEPQVDSLLVSANRNLDAYRALGFIVVDDGPFLGAGPLAGLRAGLHICATPWLLATPCDMPYLPSNLCHRLLEAAGETDRRARVPFDGVRHHYACVLLPNTALAHVNDCLDGGRRRVHDLLQAVGWLSVDFVKDEGITDLNTPPQQIRHAFSNINTAADLAALEFPTDRP